MEIKNIKVDNVDNSTRAITIKTSGKDIETPNRCISKPEITKLKGMRIKSDEPPSPFEVVDESFHWQIYQPTLEYNSKVRHNLGNINGFSKKTTSVKSTMNIPDNMLEKEESKNILKLIYPKITQKDHIEKLYMDALMEIQYNAGADVITVPEPTPGCSYEDFVNNLKNVIKFLDEFNNEKPIMPLIDIVSNKERFEEKLNYLLNQHLNSKKDFGLMGISARVYGNNMNLHILRDKSSDFEKFWIHGVGAYRKQANKNFYNPHAVTVWGIDTVSLSPQSGFNPNSMLNQGDNNSQNVLLRMYVGDSWGIHKEPLSKVENYLCDCDGCKYFRKTSDLDKLQNSLDVHEAIQSQKQMNKSRVNILENDYKELVKEKKDFKDYYQNFVGEI